MSILSNILFKAKVPNSSQEVNVYYIKSKDELLKLLGTIKTVRILYNGKDVYAWQADMLDHKAVCPYINKAVCYIGFMIDKGEIISSIESVKSPLLAKFKMDFLDN